MEKIVGQTAITEVLKLVKQKDNELQDNIDINSTAIGTISELDTTDKSSLVNAINEIKTDVDTNTTNIAMNTDDILVNTNNIAANTTSISNINNQITTINNTLSSKADSSSLSPVATSGDYNDLINTPTIPTVNDGILTIQRNSTTIDTFSANSSTNKTIDISVPTAVTDLTDSANYSLVTETGNKITLSIDSTTYELTAKLYDKNNTLINTSNVIDLPLESAIVNASYDNTTKDLIFTLQNGTTLTVPLDDMVSGLASQSDLDALELRVQTNEGNISTNTSDISDLTSDVRTNTSNINTLQTNQGVLNNLNTTNKSSLVNAINEVNTQVGTNTSDISTNTSNISGLSSRLTTAENNISTNTSDISDLETNKQDKLVAGTGISIDPNTNIISSDTYTLPAATSSTLGGIKVGTNLNITSDGTLSAVAQPITIDNVLSTTSENPVQNKVIKSKLDSIDTDINNLDADIALKQDILVSGTNIKTINNQSILGNGNITIESSSEVELITENTDLTTLENGIYRVDAPYTDAYLYIPIAQGFVLSEAIDRTSTSSVGKYIRVEQGLVILNDGLYDNSKYYAATLIPATDMVYTEKISGGSKTEDTYYSNILKLDATSSNATYFDSMHEYVTDETIADTIKPLIDTYAIHRITQSSEIASVKFSGSLSINDIAITLSCNFDGAGTYTNVTFPTGTLFFINYNKTNLGITPGIIIMPDGTMYKITGMSVSGNLVGFTISSKLKSISLNGTPLIPDANGNVDITVPTDADDISYYVEPDTWSVKTWNGYNSISGSNIWTDGENIYYSSSTYQYVLDKSTNTWSTKTWNGLTSFLGMDIWTDGENIYYSSNSNQYVLNKSTSTWSRKSWSGYNLISGSDIWTDGDNIYYSSTYQLDKSTSTWSRKSWSGLTSFISSRVWTDGENIYYSSTSDQYVLDKSTSTWITKTWNGLTSFMGSYIWTDGKNVYLSNNSNQYVLDKSTSTWNTKTWNNLTSFIGSYVWTDNENIYYSLISNQYVLDLEETTVQEAIDDLKTNTGSGGDSVPIGLISPYPASTPPHGWLLCDGSAVSRTTYKELFDVIGTSHGAGDGSTTFNLPDMPSYTPVGVDPNDSNLNAAGKKYGSKTNTHQHWQTVGSDGTLYIEPYPTRTRVVSTKRTIISGSYSDNAPIRQDSTFDETISIVQPSIAEYYMIKAFKVSVPGNDLGDTLPIGSVIDYDGDTVPEGYVQVDDILERNYNIPVYSQLMFFGEHSFIKNLWQDVTKAYGIGCSFPVTEGCERWMGISIWSSDNVTSGTGCVIGWFNNAGEFQNRQWNFGLTWGDTSGAWGSYKTSLNCYKLSDLPSGWVVFKSIIPNDSSGNAGTIKALYIDYYDVPIGKTPITN